MEPGPLETDSLSHFEQVPEQYEAPSSEDGAPSDAEEPEETVEEAKNWQPEVYRVTDLLIDGELEEARRQADQLLAVEGLPDDVAARVLRLREKVDASLAALEPPAEEPRPEIELSPGAEDERREAAEDPLPTVYYRVRWAVIGSGFSDGATGFLHLTPTGAMFVQPGQKREDWFIRWPDLSEARADSGLWDAPYPLILVGQKGQKYYVARVDRDGRYLPGEPLLAAIEERRRQQKNQHH